MTAGRHGFGCVVGDSRLNFNEIHHDRKKPLLHQTQHLGPIRQSFDVVRGWLGQLAALVRQCIRMCIANTMRLDPPGGEIVVFGIGAIMSIPIGVAEWVRGAGPICVLDAIMSIPNRLPQAC